MSDDNGMEGLVESDLLVSSYDIPEAVCQQYIAKGLHRLYPWQARCLRTQGVLSGRNLVYRAPTSGGKTLVAELLMIRRVVNTGQKALLLVPFVSMATEKVESLSALLAPIQCSVRGFHSGGADVAQFASTDVAVCTFERANSLINFCVESEPALCAAIGIIVCDEVHMVADTHRGHIVEVVLTKASLLPHCSSIQLIAMSATLASAEPLAKWLEAAQFTANHRPVPLTEFVKQGPVIYNRDMVEVRKLKPVASRRDPELLVPLVMEARATGGATLIFCASRLVLPAPQHETLTLLRRRACESCAQLLGEVAPAGAPDGVNIEGLDGQLAWLMQRGCAFYHAGLTSHERQAIESAFRKGSISALTTTPALAAGVNLPARRVIFRTPKIGTEWVTASAYAQVLLHLAVPRTVCSLDGQMSGRAGRAGIDEYGESFLMASNRAEFEAIKRLLNSTIADLQSQLQRPNAMARALLEAAGVGLIQVTHDVERFIRKTLLAALVSQEELFLVTKQALAQLQHDRLLQLPTEKVSAITSTPLGWAVFGSALELDDIKFVHGELQRARRRCMVGHELFFCYHVSPVAPHALGCPEPWQLLAQCYNNPTIRVVAEGIGLNEGFVMRACQRKPNTAGNVEASRHLRFVTALAVLRLVNEATVNEVAVQFGASRGAVQGLQQTAAVLCGCITTFCERVGWMDLRVLFGYFKERLEHGVKQELLELIRIPHVKGARARMLHRAGMQVVTNVAQSSLSQIEAALQSSCKCASELKKVARLILSGARHLEAQDVAQALAQLDEDGDFSDGDFSVDSDELL